ncbi:MAG: GAF domain-containing protein [Anaerolineales bacterium]|nr:GAF domain-containing protein [Anaerolineales bacterium]
MSSRITPHPSRLEALYEVSRALNSSLELGAALVIVIDAAIRLTGAERGFLMLADQAAGEFRFQVARNALGEPITEDAFEVSRGVVQTVVETGAPVVTLNAQNDPRFGARASVVNYYLRSIMAVPLRTRGELLGVLYVDSKTRDVEFKQGDLDLLTAFAEQAATAVVNAQWYEAQRRETEVRHILLEVSRAGQAAVSVTALAARLVDDLPEWLQCDRCGLLWVDAETGRLRPMALSRGFAPGLLAELAGRPPAAWLLPGQSRTASAPYRLAPADLIEALPAEWLTALQPVSDLLVVPLKADTHLLGILALDNALTGRPLPDALLTLAEPLGAELAGALQRLQLSETSQRQLKELTILNAIAGVAAATLSLDDLAAQVLTVASPVFEAESLEVLLVDEAAGVWRRYPRTAAAPAVSRALDQGLVGQVAASGRPARVGAVAGAGQLSALCVPLKVGERVVGVLNAERPAYQAFTAADERLLLTIAGQLATAVEKLRWFETERQQRALAEALNDVGLEFTLESELDVMLDRLLGHIARVVPYDAACVLVLDEAGVTHTRGARGYERFGPEVGAAARRLHLRVAETENLRMMAATGQPLIVADVLANPAWVVIESSSVLRSWVGAPILTRGRAVAFLSLERAEPGAYQPEHARWLAAFAGYAALALQNVALLEAAERRAAELDAVRTASLSLTSSLDLPEVLRAVLRGALSLLPSAGSAGIFLYQPERMEFGAALWADGRADPLPAPRPHGLTYTVARSGEPLVISDLRAHPLFRAAPPAGLGAMISLPLKIGARVVGVMNVAYPEPRALAEAELRIVQLLGEQAAAAIENARLFEAARKQVAELTVLHAVALAGSTSADVDALLEHVTRLSGDYLEARHFGVWLVDRTGLVLHPHASFRGAQSTVILIGEGLIGRVAQTGRAEHAADLTFAPADQSVHPDTRSQIGVPLRVNGSVVGVLDAESERRAAFSEADERLLGTVASQLSTALERARLFEAERAARAQADTLREVAGLLNTPLERAALLSQILEQLARLVRYESASIMLLEDDDQLRLAAHRGFRISAQVLETLVIGGLEHVRAVLADREPLLIANTAGDDRWQQLPGSEYIRCWLGVPLVVKDRALGILNLDSDQPGFYSHHDAEVALALANQAAVALDRLRLWEETQQRERELAILLDVARAVSSSLELDEVLHHVALAATQTLHMDGCALSTYEPAARQVATLKWYTRAAPAGVLFTGAYALEQFPVTERVIVQEDIAVVRADDPLADPAEAAVLRPTGYQTLLMLGVRASGRPVGLMELFSTDAARQFTDADLRLARAIADQTGVALENARLFRAEREQRELAEALRAAAASLGSSLDFDAVLDRLLDHIAGVVPYDTASLLLVDELVERAWVVRQRGFEQWGPAAAAAVKDAAWVIAETPALQQMVETGQASVISAVAAAAEGLPVAGVAARYSWVGAPVLAQGGVLAFVSLDKVAAGFYQPKHAERLAAFASQVGLALQNARLYAAERRRVTALTTLHDVALELGTRRQPQALLEAILAGARRLLQASAGVFYTLVPETEILAPVVEHHLPARLAGRNLTLGEEMAGRVALTGETLVAAGDLEPRSTLGVPVQWQGQLLGVLVLWDERPARFGEADVDMIRLFADRAAIAYENVRLVAALEKEKRRLELLVNLSQSLASTLDPDEVALRAMDLMRGATGADRAVLYLAEPEAAGLRLRALSGFAGLQAAEVAQVVPPGQGVVGYAAQYRRPLALPDVARDPRWVFLPRLDEQVRSAVIVPLLAGDALIGVVSLLGEQPHFYQDEHLPLLVAAAVPVALALQNAGLFAAEARRVHYLTVLNEITRSAVAIADLPKLLQALVDCLGELTGADACDLALWDEARQRPVAAGAHSSWRGLPPWPAPLQAALTRAILQAGQPVIIPDVTATPLLEPAWSTGGARLALLGLPLAAGDQQLGVALIAFQAPHVFSQAESQRAEQAAGQIALGLARARLFDETRRNAEELALASDLLRQLSMAPDILGQFAKLAAGLKRLAGCQFVLLALLAPDRQALLLAGVDETGLTPEARLPLDDHWLRPELVLSQPRFVEAVAESAEPLDQALGALGVSGWAALPLRAGQHGSGALGLFWTEAASRPLLNVTLLSQIMDALALAVEKNRLLKETLRRAAELEAITVVSADLRALDAAPDLLEILIDRSLTVFRAEAGAILMPVEARGELAYILHRNLPATVYRQVLPLTGSVAGQVFQGGRPVRAEAPAGGASALYAPLRAGHDIIGVLTITAGAQRLFTEADLRLLNTLAEVGGNALQRARVLETLEQRVVERTRELARANEQLKELDRLKDQFVSNVSHELRTPLTAIKLHLGLLDKRGAEALPRYLPVLQRETERLRRLIEDLLDLSRLRSHSAPVRREPQRLDALLTHVLALYATRAEEREVRLRHLVNETLPRVWVDQAQLTQVFANLIANAVAYTARGGQVTVSSDRAAAGQLDGVVVRVHNDGPPISPEDLAHLFTRFYRGQVARESGEPGTGLGLAISKEIVEQHAGLIDVISAEGQGTTFTVWLPLASGDAAAA